MIRDEIKSYIDGNGLITPYPAPPGMVRASDNGVMYTSEYYIILSKLSLLTAQDKETYTTLIHTCTIDDQLHRAPGDITPDEVDDYYGTLSAHVELGVQPRFQLPVRLWRQPQLLLMYLCAEAPQHWFLIAPIWAVLAFISAFVIATSCVNTDRMSTDDRRLSWHLINATARHSFLCRLASKLWYRRLYKTYGLDGMKEVAKIYYQPNGVHPFSLYWVD